MSQLIPLFSQQNSPIFFPINRPNSWNNKKACAWAEIDRGVRERERKRERSWLDKFVQFVAIAFCHRIYSLFYLIGPRFKFVIECFFFHSANDRVDVFQTDCNLHSLAFFFSRNSLFFFHVLFVWSFWHKRLLHWRY